MGKPDEHSSFPIYQDSHQPAPPGRAKSSWGSTTACSEDDRPFTVLPISEDTIYLPVDGSVVDQRIATFLNGRRSKVLFTRLDDQDHYIYGRMIVHCTLDDDAADGV